MPSIMEPTVIFMKTASSLSEVEVDNMENLSSLIFVFINELFLVGEIDTVVLSYFIF